MAIIGVDVGGTKIEIAVLNDAGKILSQKRIPTERAKGHQHIMNNISALISASLQEISLSFHEIEGIGVGLPGAVNPKNQQMINGNTSCFIGKCVASDLRNLLNEPQLNILCANDANCFALAETILGAGVKISKQLSRPTNKLIGIGIILGTGCGTGIVINGTIFAGSRGGAGEAGHSILHQNGRNCYCGKVGCAELYLSGHGLEEQYFLSTGNRKKATDIFNDSEDHSFLLAYQQDLADFLTNMTNILDPDFFVLGGGLSTHPAIYENLRQSIQQKQFLKETPAPEVLKHHIGDSAGVLGAALLIKPFELQS